MPKDSQMDNKKARKEKAKGQTPITRENQNQNHNMKKEALGKNTER
jgi:hypothetical protein